MPSSTQSGPERREVESLVRLAADPGRRRVSVGDMLAALGDRSTLMLLLLFALPNTLPAPPGTSTVLGLPLFFVTLQLARARKPWVPEWIARQSVRRSDFDAVAKRLAALWMWADSHASPRWSAIAGEAALRVAGMLGLLLSVLLVLPLPLVNIPIGISLALMGFAGLRRDGLLMVVAMAAGIGSIALSAAVVLGLARIGHDVWGTLGTVVGIQ